MDFSGQLGFQQDAEEVFADPALPDGKAMDLWESRMPEHVSTPPVAVRNPILQDEI